MNPLIDLLVLLLLALAPLALLLHRMNSRHASVNHRRPIRGPRVAPVLTLNPTATTTQLPTASSAEVPETPAVATARRQSMLARRFQQNRIPGHVSRALDIRPITVQDIPQLPHQEPLTGYQVGVFGGLAVFGYSEDYLRSLDPRTRQLAIDQVRIDEANRNSVPRLESPLEAVPVSGGGLDSYFIGDSIATGTESKVFLLKDRPNMVIKYQSNCFDGRLEIHPLLRDYWFQARLAGQNISAEVYFVSPPIKFEIHRSVKTDFKLALDSRIQCAALPDASIRYMIMEKAWMSASDWLDRYEVAGKWTPFRDTIGILQTAVSGLQRMHDQGIIHGDVHHGNVAFFVRNGVRSQGFIDFGRAFFAEETAGTPEVADGARYGYECLHSVYAMHGARSSFRDDVFGAVLMTGILLNGIGYLDHCNSLEANPVAMLQFKKEEFMFTYPGGADRVEMLNVSTDDKAAIRADLGVILDAARSVTQVDARPQYAVILAATDRILFRATE